MDYGNVGYSAGGGIMGAILGAIATWIGFKSRLDAQDRRVDGVEKRINNISDAVIYKDTFAQFEKRFDSVCISLKQLNEKMDKLIDRQLSDR